MTAPILSAEHLVKYFATNGRQGWHRNLMRAVDDVSLHINEGETLAIVGESGSGKTTLARMLLGLVDPSLGRVLFQGAPLHELTRQERRDFRRSVQPIFQDPASSLNPRMRIDATLGHVLREQGVLGAPMRRLASIELLHAVGLSPAETFLARYPHQLSGGQQQRIAIARAMAVKPRLIVADEPLSSLDMTVQAQVLDLFVALKQNRRVALVLISHDLNLVEAIADRVIVLYLGRVVEVGAAREVLHQPRHNYTRTLMEAKLAAHLSLARRRNPIDIHMETP